MIHTKFTLHFLHFILFIAISRSFYSFSRIKQKSGIQIKEPADGPYLAHGLRLDDHAGLLHPTAQCRGGSPAGLVMQRGHAPMVPARAARVVARPALALRRRGCGEAGIFEMGGAWGACQARRGGGGAHLAAG
jgi:hypothetical protein